jgi:hypothetical protein
VTERRIFGLVHAEARKRAAQACAEAPEGWRVTIEPPKRTLDQNSLLWPLLTAFSEQLEWPVNGSMTKLEPGEWKDILSAAYRKESARVALGLNGGMVLLGLRTSRMGKREFSEFVEFVLATAADRGVVTERDEVAA